ncbi:SMI1/KNR4 family protein [Bradyrhizobium betae]
MALPGYAEYVARRKAGTSRRAGAGSKARRRARADITAAEQALGVRLPDDYRKFLLKRGETELLVRLPESSSELRFYAPDDLAKQLHSLLGFIAYSDDEVEEACTYFRKRVRGVAEASRCRLPSRRSSAAACCSTSSPANVSANAFNGTMTARGSWSSSSHLSTPH